jgi:antirestriction protein
MTKTTEPQAYIVSLTDYNNGVLHGVWVELTYGAEHVYEEIEAMLAESPTAKETGEEAEEWAVHDLEGLGDITEHDIEELCELAEGADQYGEAYLLFVENYGNSLISEFQDSYRGEFNSEVDYAYELIESTGMLDGVDPSIARYFDYESFARDMFMDGFTFIEGKQANHVFDDNF